MPRIVPAAALSGLLLGALACNNQPLCTSTACNLPLALNPSTLAIQSTQGLAPGSAQTTLSSASASPIPFAIACTNGVTISPSSGTVSSGSSQQLTVTAPAQAAVGTLEAICTVTATQDAAETAKLTLTVAVSADLGDAGNSGDAGVSITGGAVDHLYFAVVGDSRPANIDDIANYPTQVISKIYQGVEALSPRPQFVLGTGDYLYATPTANTAQPQASLYMQARAAFSGVFFPAMGNHECDGYTADNCTVNQTQNNVAFMSTILGPNQQALPYYAFPVNAKDNSWTSKFLMIACNAWSPAQKSWLQAQLAQATTYTFLVRHEPAEANTGPCVNDVEAMMSGAAYDLSLVGHTHEFKGSAGSKEIVIGNGGAPLSFGTYGYTTVERVTAGWQIINYDYATGLPQNTFTVPAP